MTNDPNNPFLHLADAQMSAATKRAQKRREVKIVKSERDAPMKPSELMQKLDDQVRMYRAWKKAEIDRMLTVHGEQWKLFIHHVKHLAPENKGLFLDNIGWLLNEDLPTRQVALAVIANHLINLRLAQGLSPIDDSLPGEQPTLFEIIREKLRVMTP